MPTALHERINVCHTRNTFHYLLCNMSLLLSGIDFNPCFYREKCAITHGMTWRGVKEGEDSMQRGRPDIGK